MDSIISALKDRPGRGELINALSDAEKALPTSSVADALNLYATLLSTTLPDLGYNAPEDVITGLVGLFKSVRGLNVLVSRISSLANDVLAEDSKLKDKTKLLSHIILYGAIVGRVVDKGALAVVLLQREGNEREISSLFAGSKLLLTMSLAAAALERQRHQLTDEDIRTFSQWKWLSDGVAYTSYLSLEIVGAYHDIKGDAKLVDALASILDKVLKLGYPEVVGYALLTRSHVSIFVQLFSRMRNTQQWYCFSKCLVPVLQQKMMIDDAKVGAVAAILGQFEFQGSNVESFFTHAESGSVGQLMRRALVLLASDRGMIEQEFKEMLRKWGGAVNIMHTPLMRQEAQTELLVFSLKFLSSDVLKQVEKSPIYLHSISNRLSATANRARFYGIMFGERFSAASGDAKPLQFGVEDSYDAEFKAWAASLNNGSDVPVTYSSASWDALESTHEPVVDEPADEAADERIQEIVDEAPAPKDEDQERTEAKTHDSDDEEDGLVPYAMPEDDAADSDDDPELASKPKVQPPVYVRDLISYLAAEDSYEKITLGLSHGARLVRQKAKFGQELAFHAKELASTVAGMRNAFDIDNFDSLRLNVLTALVASAPDVVPQYLSELLLTADYSLQQRITVLSGIVLGARELAGLQDVAPAEAPAFPSKMLPEGIHEKFLPSAVDTAALELEKRLLLDTADEATETTQISGPKVLRVSKKLQNDRERGPEREKIITNRYAKLASRHFFFPLVAQWYAHGGFQDLGTYSSMLVAHFFKSLALLLSSAYPTSNELPQMSAELLALCMETRASQHMPVVESILTSVLVILDVNDPEAIVTQWPRQTVELREWLSDTMDRIPDERVRALAGGVLYRLLDISQRWERRLIGEEQALDM